MAKGSGRTRAPDIWLSQHLLEFSSRSFLHPPKLRLGAPCHYGFRIEFLWLGLRQSSLYHGITRAVRQVSDQFTVPPALHCPQAVAAAGSVHAPFDFAEGRRRIQGKAQMPAPAVFEAHARQHRKTQTEGPVVNPSDPFD